ncbi:MAG: Holliday junction DNA helicase RuvA [uncultured Campylobacterales bacterium]|uniref:Holliday junction branch migration complex subunit RuvA n=1 Tax=uncultured Campylobacterales bacterium TaxID=352960 RepID=A0A6S6S1H7_9BACT|nr:MAG: Holliday junction DNA helicase RuvA [uncultured Campylobacterales bacterium]
MIVEIEGDITLIEPTFIHLKVGGITHKLFVSINTSSSLKKEFTNFHIVQIIKEESNSLYGFLSIDEQKVFQTLIKINGVGPSTAMAVCSTYSPQNFLSIVSSNDVRSITMVPGIGPKSAKRILIELSEFSLTNITTDKYIQDTVLALESLGFKNAKIKSILKDCTANDTASLVKEALQKLAK